MANLGSDDTPIVGESFGLPSGWSITENAAGEVVIEDSGGNVVFRRDETAGEWVTDSIGAESVSTESLETNSITHLKENESLQAGIDRAHNDEIAILFVPPGTYSDDITLKEGVGIVGALGVNNVNDPAMRRFIDSRDISGEPPAVTMERQTALIGFQTGSDGFDVVIETESDQCRISDCVLQTGNGLEINGNKNFVRFNEIRDGITDNGIDNQLVGNVT